jgi:hypothetical protein
MKTLMLAAATIACAACSMPEVAVYPDGFDAPQADPAVTFSLRGEGHSVVARVRDLDILSADVNLGRFPGPAAGGSALRGTAFGRPVDLDTGVSTVAGMAGASPLDLSVTRLGTTLRAKGLVRGHLSDFRLDTDELAGTIGACSYELARTSDGYEGRRSCGGPSEQIMLRLPASLDRWSDSETAAALALLMGAGH